MLIGLGDGPLNCESPSQQDPPSGMFATMALPSFDVGSYSNVVVTVYQNNGSFHGTGTSNGSVDITASTAESITGTVSYSYTDTETQDTYGLNGSFEVVRCP